MRAVSRSAHGIHSSSTNWATRSNAFFARSLTRSRHCITRSGHAMVRTAGMDGPKARLVSDGTHDDGNLGRHNDCVGSGMQYT